jgi:hypothetical protein
MKPGSEGRWKGRRGAPRWGFSLLEVLLAVIFLTIGLTALFSVFTFSNRGTLDAYRETLAYCLAQEGLEFVAGLGYDELLNRLENDVEFVRRVAPDRYRDPLEIPYDDGSVPVYPEDFRQFERMIEIVNDADCQARRVVVVRVTVRPKEGFFFRKGSVVLEKVLGADYGS